MLERVDLFGLPLDLGVTQQDVIDLLGKGPMLLTYLNPLGYRIKAKSKQYSSHLDRFDLVVCDGIGVQKAARLVYKQTTAILTPDYSGIGRAVLRFCAHNKMSLCLIGGKTGVAKKAGEKIAQEFPDMPQVTAFEGFGESLDHARRHVLEEQPQMVMLGLGMGRQESYLLELADSGWRGAGICVRGLFDKLADPALDYPSWSQERNVRFLGRIVQEPRRMLKRYFIDYQPFVAKYVKALLLRR